MVLDHHVLYIGMTLITMQGGAVVMRDGKVGTEQACCCPGECICGQNCTQDIQVDFVKGDLSGTINVAPGAFGSANLFSNTQFALVTVTSSCGTLGPNGECGWLIEVLVCGCVDDANFPFNCDAFSSTWHAFAPVDGNGCPDVGDLTFECVGGDCEGTVAGTVT